MAAKKTRKIKGHKLNNRDLKREVSRYLKSHPGKQYSPRQLIKRLKIANDKRSVQSVLDQMAGDGRVLRDGDTYFIPVGSGKSGKAKHYIGHVDMTRSGSAYIVVEGRDDDIFVRAGDLNSALDSDKVEVALVRSRQGRPRGRVVRILERSRDQFIGTFYAFKTYSVVVPESQTVSFDIIVPPKRSSGAENNDKVVVKVDQWPGENGRAPEGHIVLVFGKEDSSDIDMQAILLEHGFDLVFPENVLKAAQRLPKALGESDLKGRRDFRDVTTFTIDPITAKDFDDALSIRHLDDGEVEVGVHIADVTHFVQPGDEIDREAYRRSTSVYLVDRVAPMLPEQLSNELCSLRPQEDSLCFSAVFVFDKDHTIVKRWYGKTVIFSDRRFAYEEAQEILEAGKGEYADELKVLNDIATALRERKMKNGALMFETDEVQFILDEEGVPIEVLAKERKEAHLLVEDFMLLANKEVARYIGDIRKDANIPFVYRIHDTPDQEKIEELARFARGLGFEMKVDTPAQIKKSFNALAEAASENEALMVLEPLAIRTMAKAEYNVDNIGHYGLAFGYYTHFTSPIRRYSDVLVHRILYANIDGRIHRENPQKLQDKCVHISAKERSAQKAERDSIKYKHAEFLQKHIGEEFNGFISGMIDRGVFVKLEHNHAEGLVDFSTMNEAFSITESQMIAVGNRSGKTLKMGDRIRVRIVDADPPKREIDMKLVDDDNAQSPG